MLATESSKASDEPSPPSTPADAPANIAAKAAVGAKLDDEEEIVDLDITTTQTQTSGTQAGGENSGPPLRKSVFISEQVTANMAEWVEPKTRKEKFANSSTQGNCVNHI